MGFNWKFWKRNKKVAEDRKVKGNAPEYNAAFNYKKNYISTCKYNVFSFLPRNLFEQFTRVANLYFLILLILQCIPAISSLKWQTTMVPLVVVILISMLKDAMDDIQRYFSDKKVNNRMTQAMRNGLLEEISWSKVVVGDIIKLESDQFVTADLVLLSTSQENSLCYVETSELDGETNLKVKESVPQTTFMVDDLNLLSRFNGLITCEAPNNVLNRFDGKLEWNGVVSSLDNDKVLLRGCKIRNTRWCYGLVIFAGKDTKLMMNSGKSQFKRTHIDRLMNQLIIGIICCLGIMCLVCSIGAGFWEVNFGTHFQAYLPWESYIPGSVFSNDSSKSWTGATVTAILVFFSYIIILNTVVPISLYVSVEILRFSHSWWINWDQEMYHKESNTAARSRTTTLNEELGQIEYIFSDKTGTLTQNVMTFNKCSINGMSYGDYTYEGKPVDITEDTPKVDFSPNPFSEPTFTFYDQKLLKAVNDRDESVADFFRLLALCHTVIAVDKEGKLVYEAQSPDENALVSAARNFGFVYKDRSPTMISIDVLGSEENYEQLCILDFNNIRKRMSIIVRKDGKIRLLCKGADSTVYERLDGVNKKLQDQTKRHFETFAQDGLRTLCLASKDIDGGYYEEWKKRHHEASISLENRDDKLSAVYEEIEEGMQLVGATGIEDKLQDGVPEAIANLMLADIKIWVLTGDKPETAINIGYSSHLLTEEMGSNLYVIEEDMENKSLSKEQKWEAVKEQLVLAYSSINKALNEHSHTVMGASNGALSLSDENLRNNNRSSGNSYSNATFEYGNRISLNTTTNNTNTSNSTQNTGTNNNSNSTHNTGSNSTHNTSSNYQHNSSTSTHNNSNYSKAKQPEFGLVIDGNSLVHALKPGLDKLFLEAGCLCKAVICCRVTPLQKAMVVNLVKKNKRSVTLSIGDGANDVSMIKKAHIGIGISGQEGMQAVLASDFSIAQFRYLERLLLVHGRWSYMRVCKFLKYFFYKNFAFTLCHFWFAFFSGFSAQTLYDPYFIALYNLIFTSLPVLALAIFDQDVSAKVSLQYPKLYTPGHLNYFFNKKVFAQSILEGFLTSMVLYFLSYGAYQDTVDSGGHDIAGLQAFGVAVSASLILIVTIRCCLETYFWTGFNIAAFCLSILSYFVYELIAHSAWKSETYFGTDMKLWKTATYWFTYLLSFVVILITVVAEKYYFIDTRPTLVDRLRHQSSSKGFRARKGRARVIRRASTMRKSTRSVGRSGYAFSHEEGFGDLITSGNITRRSMRDAATREDTNPSLVGHSVIGSFKNKRFKVIPEDGIGEVREGFNGNNGRDGNNGQHGFNGIQPAKGEFEMRQKSQIPSSSRNSETGQNEFRNSGFNADEFQRSEPNGLTNSGSQEGPSQEQHTSQHEGVLNQAYDNNTLDKLKQRQRQLVDKQLKQEIMQRPQNELSQIQRETQHQQQNLQQETQQKLQEKAEDYSQQNPTQVGQPTNPDSKRSSQRESQII